MVNHTKKYRELWCEACDEVKLFSSGEIGVYSPVVAFRDETEIAVRLAEKIIEPCLIPKGQEDSDTQNYVCIGKDIRYVPKDLLPIEKSSVYLLQVFYFYEDMQADSNVIPYDREIQAAEFRVQSRELIREAANGKPAEDIFEDAIKKSIVASKKAMAKKILTDDQKELVKSFLIKRRESDSRSKSKIAAEISALLNRGEFPGIDAEIVISPETVRKY